MHRDLETDYLVVGAGAAGMAITDELLAHTDATVTIVDRRHRPGGHWVDAYPFVRLHQPSAFYGVSSMPLGQDTIDTTGTNEGFYELAGADEIRAYYERVMSRQFLSSGRVQYFPGCDYVGEHRFVSRMSGASWQVRVARKLIDTTYMEGNIPATCPPPFAVAEGARCVPAGEIARLDERPERYVIVGAGKTALDACVWLLERGVSPADICWIKPREAWWLNRKFQQPYTMLPEFYRGAAMQIEALAESDSKQEVFERLESSGVFLRVDPNLPTTMFRGAILSEHELELLRQIENVVRLGYVRRIERDEIILDGGRIPTTEQTLHVHCAARALADKPLCPIFEPGRITVQPFFWSFACYQFATLGVIEATVDGDDEKNRLAPPIHYWDKVEDYLAAYLASMQFDRRRSKHPELARWQKSTRLNAASGAAAHAGDPTMIAAREAFKRHGAAAAANIAKLLGAS